MLEVEVAKRQGEFSGGRGLPDPTTGITVLFGPSGAGKTSVVNMVAGLSRPDQGSHRRQRPGSVRFDARNQPAA